MGLKLNRKKKRNIKLSIAYRLGRFLPLNSDKKLKLYLDLAWIFSRLAHEQTFKSSIKIPYDASQDFLVNQISKEDRVLDIGCGEGYVIQRLLNKTSNILGIDYQEKSIEKAKRLLDNQVELICDDIHHYIKNHPEQKFDVIVLSHVLEHIDNPQKFLKDIRGYANYFYIEVPDFEASHLNVFRQYVKTDLVYTDADHVSEFDRRELQDLMNNTDLEVLKAEFNYGVMKLWCKKRPDA